MKVTWTPRNTEKVERHGLTQKDVEAVFRASDLVVSPIPGTYRLCAEGGVAGRFLRVIFTRSGPGEVYPITAYRTSPRRRRT